MQIDLYDTEEFIKINNLKPVTDPVIFVRGATPSANGLLSTDIFGVSREERKLTYAYIDLHTYFLNPFIYKLLKRVNRNFEHIVHCTRKFVIKEGDLIEDENGETGLTFLYKNWEKLNFKKNNSLIRGERIDVLSAYKKNVIFTKYVIVIPAYYRDVNFQNNTQGKLSHHELNDKYYGKIIRLASLIKNSNDFDFVMNTTMAKLQDVLVELYDYLKSKIEKKQGMIRKSSLGKSTDYGSRLVISAPVFHAEKYDDMLVDFYHSGVPLAQCCSLFTPFIVAWVRNYFRQTFESIGNKYPYEQKDGTVTPIELDSPEIYFDGDLIKKEIAKFIKAPADRFERIELPVKDKSLGPVYFKFTGRLYDKTDSVEMGTIDRHTTWCDIFYQAAVDVTRDKMVYVTRYPLTDYFGIFPSEVSVMSTKKTVPVIINGKVYTHYPNIDLKMDPSQVAISFVDTLSMSNVYLLGLGGDYDGDQITIKGVFTQEANEEARRIMMSKAHILGINGSNMRTTKFEGIQTLYMLTRFE